MNKLILLGASVLTGVMSMSASSSATTRLYANVGSWKVSYDTAKSECMAVRPYQYGETGLAIYWSYNQRNWYFIFANRYWSMRPYSRFKVRIAIDGRFVSQGTAVVFENGQAFSITFSKNLTHTAIMQRAIKRGYVMDVNRTTRVSLRGTYRAFATVERCANDMANRAEGYQTSYLYNRNGRPHSRSQQGLPWTLLPRSDALSLVVNILNKAGISGYELLPRRPKHHNTIEFRYRDGAKASFIGAKGKTPTADELSSSILETYSIQCKGDFASGIRKVPTTSGTVRRLVKGKCTDGSNSWIRQATVVRFSDGRLYRWSIAPRYSAPSLKPNVSDHDRVIEAAFKRP